MIHVVKRCASRLLLVVLLVFLGATVVPPPMGAIEPFWAEAANLQAAKSYSAAVEVYEQIAVLDPHDPKPLLAIGEIFLTQHRWPLAEDAFNRALTRDGENVQALAGLAMARWEQGDRVRGITLWEMAVATLPTGTYWNSQEPDLPGVRLRLALAYLELDRRGDAEAVLRQEAARSDSPAAHLYLAMMQAGDNPTAARHELALIRDNAPPAAVEARDYFLEAIQKAEAADTAADTLRLIGLAFVQIGEWQLAQHAFDRALMLDPTDVETMAFLGHTEAQLGEPAFGHLAEAVQSRPDWPLGHYLLGLYYLKQGAYEFAAEEFRSTLRLDPGNAQALAELARAHISLGQYLEAEQALIQAIEAAPNDLGFHLALVRFYADHTFRVTDRGLAAAETAADLAPEDPQAQDALGWMYFLAGDTARARLHLESSLRLNPELASAHYHLGVLRTALGEEEAAQFAFLRTTDLDLNGFYRDQALTALREMAQTGD